ncbi:hypothetical protein AKO1_007454, partial [Acrasis kona]
MLMMLAGRVSFDKDMKSSLKMQGNISIQKEIYMDRFMLDNEQDTKQIRAKIRDIQENINNIEQTINQIKNYNGSGIGIDAALEVVGKYFFDQYHNVPTNSNNKRPDQTTYQKVQNEFLHVTTQIKNYTLEMDHLKKQLSLAYSDTTTV